MKYSVYFQLKYVLVFLSFSISLSCFAGPSILRLESKPGGAQVYIDGTLKGATPTEAGKALTIELSEGRYTIKLRKEGFKTINKNFSIGADANLLASYKLSRELFTNSLGMRFVPIPDNGRSDNDKQLLFSLYETRVRDFRAFVEASEYHAKTGFDGKPMLSNWESPGFSQTDEHPVVFVSWSDAQAFCKWLTEHERKHGNISSSQSYRLPTDHEWSCAVGIGKLEQEPDLPPRKKDGKITNIYPWGPEWPPTQAVGNYKSADSKQTSQLPADGYIKTAPVGSFQKSTSGLYDLGGNVWEYCETKWQPSMEARVLRGGSWNDGIMTARILASGRTYRSDTYRQSNEIGFRCVLDGDEGSD